MKWQFIYCLFSIYGKQITMLPVCECELYVYVCICISIACLCVCVYLHNVTELHLKAHKTSAAFQLENKPQIKCQATRKQFNPRFTFPFPSPSLAGGEFKKEMQKLNKQSAEKKYRNKNPLEQRKNIFNFRYISTTDL